MANWVVGYPVQSDREIDLMYEAESEKMWEELNNHDALWDKALESVGYLNVVEEHMDKGLDSLIWAKEDSTAQTSSIRFRPWLNSTKN